MKHQPFRHALQLCTLLYLSVTSVLAGEWEILFDGSGTEALRGYQMSSFPSKGWDLGDDATLRSNPDGQVIDIITKKKYQHFELVFEWRSTPGANSGVMYKVQEISDKAWHTGPEYQILDDSKHPDAKDRLTSAGSLYGLVSAEGKTLKPIGEFNHSRILLSGNLLEHWLNGKKVVACRLGSFGMEQLIAKSKFSPHKAFAKSSKGHIVFQHHHDEVWFRNIKIRSLPESMQLMEPKRANTLSKAWREIGWRNLFNGKNTDRWRGFKKEQFPEKGWRIVNDCLTHVDKGGGGDIITKSKYGQFDFQWEWKVAPAANSGVKYFIMEERGGAIGHEYQVIDDTKHPDAQRGPKWQTAAFYDVFSATNRVLQPVGSFNRSRIQVKEQEAEHWLNGIMVLSYKLGSKRVLDAVATSKFSRVEKFGFRHQGHILLQDHQDEVHYRNLRIKRLGKKRKP
ncbi:MAG: DUF1080 domain-containing protein [Verrucomicrobiota bacterium]|nr:DUF1080 domain-containing protein [Verrucomicrobiota bacterium]